MMSESDLPAPQRPKVQVALKVAIFMAVVLMKKKSFSFDEFLDSQMSFILAHTRQAERKDPRSALLEELFYLSSEGYFIPTGETGRYEVARRLYDEWESLHKPPRYR